jgi:hypothetical protein
VITFEVRRSTPIARTPRVVQLEGLFDIPPRPSSEIAWRGELPLDERPWRIGLVYGPSGSGKTTLAGEIFGPEALARFEWPAGRSILDGFPESLTVRQVTGLLSSVGFSSPPSWLRPFEALSTGERFRANLARALAVEGTVVVDEFTSVVDRTVARIGSAAVAKAIRARTDSTFRFVGVSCHDDVIEWLDPDWIYHPASGAFDWRLERRRRPDVALEIARVHRSAWTRFKSHHYLSGALHRTARCFAGYVDHRPAAFVAVLPFPHPRRPGWREHRAVCLPDYQGIGIGNALSGFVASLFVATGKPYRSTTSHPAMIRHRARSRSWRMIRQPSVSHGGFRGVGGRSQRALRVTASFEFVGPARPDEARLHEIVPACAR